MCMCVCFYMCKPLTGLTLSMDVSDKACICIVVLVITYILGLQSITSDSENKGSGGHIRGKQNHKQKKLMRLFCYFIDRKKYLL